MKVKKFNFFEDYEKASKAVNDLKYILSDEGIESMVNGPQIIIRNIYYDKVPSFLFITVCKNGWDTYDIQGSEDFQEFINRLKDELEGKYTVQALNYNNLLYMIVEIKLKYPSGI